ncbi:MAG: DUF3501 family protein [Alphaproteobacteria bacterium]
MTQAAKTVRKREITRADIMPMEAYAEARKERRAAITALKRNRRVQVGPYATFYFENYDTMWQQVHEMLFIERGGEAQVADELDAYNPLIPQGRELVATLMFEIADARVRQRTLSSLGHVEDTIELDVGGTIVKAASAEHDTERTNEEGKTSSVHFLKFPLSDEAIRKFKTPGTRITLGFGHRNYGHLAVVPEPVRAALAEDLD